jgi:hypothetical protein
MPSFVWNRDPREAYSEPYEYPGHEQFAREAKTLLRVLGEHYTQKDAAFTRDDVTREKAVWMLQVDSLEALEDCLSCIVEKKHRIAARLFRDALETQDVSWYLAKAGIAADAHLKDWFANEVIPHRVARDFVKRVHGTERFEELRSLYGGLSKYTHRTYRALAMSYVLARDQKLAYDGFRRDSSLVLPHVISFCYAVLAMLIKRLVEVAIATEQLTAERAEAMWVGSLEIHSVPRRFGAGVYHVEFPIVDERG